VRILLWRGYLLGGTGSNVYTRAIAREWSRSGHDVVLVSQEPHPEHYDLAGASAVRPDIGGLLPVFVLDRYEGLEAKLLQDFTPAERDRYVNANAAPPRARSGRSRVCQPRPDRCSGGRCVGPPRLPSRRTDRSSNTRCAGTWNWRWGRETLADARAVFVGSGHIREVLEEVVGHIERVHEVPPGVDVDQFRPLPRAQALYQLLEESRRDPPNPGNAHERRPDEGNAERLADFLAGDEPTILYFGKLLRNKASTCSSRRFAPWTPRSHRRLWRLPGGAGSPGGAADALHGPARASPPRQPDPARRRHRRTVDLPRGVRHGRGGGGGGQVAPTRCPAFGPGRNRRRARSGGRAGELRNRRRRRSGREAPGDHGERGRSRKSAVPGPMSQTACSSHSNNLRRPWQTSSI
jgi:hypothetical protein